MYTKLFVLANFTTNNFVDTEIVLYSSVAADYHDWQAIMM